MKQKYGLLYLEPTVNNKYSSCSAQENDIQELWRAFARCGENHAGSWAVQTALWQTEQQTRCKQVVLWCKMVQVFPLCSLSVFFMQVFVVAVASVGVCCSQLMLLWTWVLYAVIDSLPPGSWKFFTSDLWLSKHLLLFMMALQCAALCNSRSQPLFLLSSLSTNINSCCSWMFHFQDPSNFKVSLDFRLPNSPTSLLCCSFCVHIHQLLCLTDVSVKTFFPFDHMVPRCLVHPALVVVLILTVCSPCHHFPS